MATSWLRSARWITMKPPPPMLPACGWVTASAKPTATAASTALLQDFDAEAARPCLLARHHAVPREHGRGLREGERGAENKCNQQREDRVEASGAQRARFTSPVRGEVDRIRYAKAVGWG